MGERESIRFCVSLREISSDSNDSDSLELTLGKIQTREKDSSPSPILLFDLSEMQCDSEHRRYSAGFI